MKEILLVRQPGAAEPTDAEKTAARRVLFGAIDGLGEAGRKAWRRFIGGLFRMEPGEIVEVRVHKKRSTKFHRRHFAIEQALFESQERFEHLDQMLYWLKVGAGWVTWAAGPKGGVVPIPRSISFSAANDIEFREFHDRVIAFLRGPHAAPYLWPHLGDKAHEMVESILAGFEE